MEPLVIVKRIPPLAIVELNRKDKRNALNMALRDALEEALCALESDAAIKAVVLTGGDAFFCAGYDLQEMMDTDLRSLMHRSHEYTRITYFFKKPLVAAVAGFALAGGFDLALSADVIVAAAGAKLGRPEIGWGVNPLMSKLGLRIGFSNALRMTLQGATWQAEEARQAGLVDFVVAQTEILAAAVHQAELLAKHPLPALIATKRAAYAVATMSPEDAIAYELGVTAELVGAGTLNKNLRDYAASISRKS
ncbi:MAG: enoyl-CoA hydratase/isomerase family protein [Burkholderiaceae bacterium]|nr:enoyl-CoA hydratase/isomerase family protein [Burkholderiaceae bacterium]